MKKQNKTLIILIAIGVVIFAGYEGFGWKKYVKPLMETGFPSELGTPVSKSDKSEVEVKAEAWQVVEEYLGYAKAHDLEGIKKLTYTLSETCTDESKREECYELMDSVYNIISIFKSTDFKHVLWNDRKITLFTDYKDGTRTALYFIKDNNALKIAGMKFCFGDNSIPDECSSL